MAKRQVLDTVVNMYDDNGMLRQETFQKQWSFKSNEDPFYMTFIGFISWMYNIKSIVSIKLLCKLLEIAQFNTGEVSISMGLRKQLISELDISPSAFTKALNDLVDNKALFPKCIKTINKGVEETKVVRGEYIINASMFWKGELSKRTGLKVIFTAETANKTKDPMYCEVIDMETGEIRTDIISNELSKNTN